MTMDITEQIRLSLIGELENLRDAVKQLAEPLTDQELWIKPVDPGNSIGHLILHLTGNLNHFIGAQLGGTGYVREREREFTESEPPSRKVLFDNLDAAVAIYRRVVVGLSAEKLAAPHPDARFGTILQALIRVLLHFSVHRGQMSYIERLVKPLE